jgi:RNA polymerase sigma-70 factor (ECF subfamily)
LSAPAAAPAQDPRDELAALAQALRPELLRYCARMMGSVIEGEDVVQDTLIRALAAWPQRDAEIPLRPWLLRIAHNRALDLLRARRLRAAESLDIAPDTADPANPDPMEELMRQETLRSSVSRFAELPIQQRSVVILKDVLDESLQEVAGLLDLTVDAVKSHLARGRARLRQLNAQAGPPQAPRPASPEVAQYVALFNRQDWQGLRALLADEVKLRQSSHPLRTGVADVGMFFSIYARCDPVRLAPAWLDGREVIAVFDPAVSRNPAYMMWLTWRDGRIEFIRDYRHDRYVAAEARLVLAPRVDPM